ncbi:MAG TPA: hypothetical protein VHO70_23770 [Chitinispirillaceae bacterium]|nr:hypothetical protein [Chitinispirillaceae bacterium]
MNAVSKISGIILIVSGCLFAQNSETSVAGGIAPEQRMDMLFDKIVRSIPEQSKKLSDTAVYQSQNQNHPLERSSVPETVRERRSEMTRALPDDLRNQVERAIEEIDLKKIEHSPSFIENRSANK